MPKPIFCYYDSETFSVVSLKTAGLFRYAHDSSAKIILHAWALGDDPVSVEEEMTPELLGLIRDPSVTFVAHNADFDRTMLRLQGYDIPLHRWWCTAAQARSHSMPGGLDKLCQIFELPDDMSKDKEGKRLVQLFCKPGRKSKKHPDGKISTPETHPEDWEKFRSYAQRDVVSMRTLKRQMPTWNYGYGNRARWFEACKINDRGFAVDIQLAEQAVATVDRVRERMDARTATLTGGEVQAATQRDRLIAHLLSEYGVFMSDLRSDTVETTLSDENIPDEVKELLRIRLQAGGASVSKYKAVLRSHVAGRLYGTLVDCGAQRTGRRSGRIFQPQNMARVPKRFPGSSVLAKHEYDIVAEMIRQGCVDLLVDDPLETMGYMTRGAIIAGPGKKLNVADLSNIEGRMMAYLANETWKLQAFREYDLDPDNMTKDLYVVSYSRAFNIPVEEVAADAEAGGVMRQGGKVQELSLQYWGGRRALQKMARVYGLEYSDEQSSGVVKAWRAANKATMNFGGNLENAARSAIRNPGTEFWVGLIKVVRHGTWLKVVLPSGRALCYPRPRVDDEGQISYWGINIYNKKWCEIITYGGKLGENVVQAASADFMMENEISVIEPAGYDIVLDVHDEVVTETPDDARFNGMDLGRLLATTRPWSVGMPAMSKGFSTKRYTKG